MSWHFLQEQEAASWEGCCLGGAPSALLRLMPTAAQSCSPGNVTVCSIHSLSGGFPCQDISCAGKGAGLTGERSGLWVEMARVIREVRPRFAFVENSPMLTSRGLGIVLGDLAEMGFDARWGVLGARHVGAPHKRDRIWIVAHTQGGGLERRCDGDGRQQAEGMRLLPAGPVQHAWPPRPGEVASIPRAPDGVAHRVDRLRSIGNGQVPAVAALAWETLT
jgi:DNA (cytosine-5)-methyltransferase 1